MEVDIKGDFHGTFIFMIYDSWDIIHDL